MKNLGFATIITGGLAAAVLGLAAPASAAITDLPIAAAGSALIIPAGIDHHSWLDQIAPKVNVPKVDNTVRHSGR
jgi:hypothetical protein